MSIIKLTVKHLIWVCQLIHVKLENSGLIMENIEMVGKDGHPPQEQCYLLYHNQIMFLGQIIYSKYLHLI